MHGKSLSYTKQQIKDRPNIRQVAEQFLNDNLRSQLENFLQYIKENKMPLSLCRSNTYESKFKTNTVFRIEIALGQACQKDIYSIIVYTDDNPCHYHEEKRDIIQNQMNEYLTTLENDDMVNYFVTHLPRCRGCGKCKPGITLDILGKSCPAVCACDMYAMRVVNPDETDYMMIKEFIYARKQHILKNAMSN